jgi:hypothetical protein
VTTTGVGGQAYNDNVTLGANATLDAGTGPITLNGTVQSPGMAYTLALNSGGTTTLGGAVGGGGNPLAGLTTNVGGTTAVNGGSVTTTGAGGQAYNDNVTLGANTTLDAGTGPITFNGTLESPGTAYTLALNSSGTATLGGAVGGGGNPLAGLTTNAGGTTDLNGGAVTTAGNQTYNDPVQTGVTANLTATGAKAVITFGKTVDATAAGVDLTVTAGGAGTILFNDDVGQAAPALNSLTAETNGGTILFTSPAVLQKVNAVALVSLNPAGHTAVPDVAPIEREHRSGNVVTDDAVDLAITLGPGGNFTMGQNEKMTVIGQLDITAPGTATLGDLTTLNDMTVHAGAIALLARPAANLLNYKGLTERDRGLGFVAGGLIDFDKAPTGDPTAQFADSGGVPPAGLAAFVFRQYPAKIEAKMLHRGGDSLSLRPQGITIDETVILPAVDKLVPVVTSEAGPGAEQTEQLRKSLKIDVRNLRPDEIALRLLMLGQINDVYLGRTAETHQVARPRIPQVVAQMLLDAYNRTFKRDPGQKEDSLKGEIMDAFQKAWEDHQKAAGDPPAEGDAARRAYVDKFADQLVSNPQNKATEAAVQLGTIFSLLERVGLSSGEQAMSRTATLEGLVPDTMGQADMEQVIEYVSKRVAAEALTTRR